MLKIQTFHRSVASPLHYGLLTDASIEQRGDGSGPEGAVREISRNSSFSKDRLGDFTERGMAHSISAIP